MKLAVTEDFRRSMNWLHTWFGIVLGGLLFAIFWTGTLSVFDAEIDQWMKPELRLAYAEEKVSLDAHLKTVLSDLPENGIVNIRPPKPRRPTVEFNFPNANGEFEWIIIDPSTSQRLKQTRSLGATGFFFPFHFRLHLNWMGLGYWIVGLAAMAMLALLVSGVFIHRKILQDFFTFRPKKTLRRSTLDLHNLTAVIAFPFHFLMPLTGLIIFFVIYLPWGVGVPFDGDRQTFAQEVFGLPKRTPAGEPMADAASIDAMVSKAELTWSERTGQAERADLVRIFMLGDANSQVHVKQIFPSRRVTMNKHNMIFEAETGDMILDDSAAALRTAHGWLAGLHFVQFDHMPLRWLYFAAGLAGCVMIATGNLAWMRARMRKEGEPLKVRVIRALTVGSTTGIIAASAAFLVANRLLPSAAELVTARFDRSDLEVLVFCVVWIASFGHAAIRDRRAWMEQAFVIGIFAAAAALLNWITTGDHLVTTVGNGLWAVAGADLMLIASAALAIWTAFKLSSVKAETSAHGSEEMPQNHSKTYPLAK